MGFIYDGTEEAPGNVGLYYQLLGLKWVKYKLYFYFNSHRITLF